MKILVGMVAAVLAAASAVGAGVGPVGFEESEGFQTEGTADGIGGWSASAGGAAVAGEGSPSGSQHLEIGSAGSAATVTRVIAAGEWGSKAIGYYDFWVKPEADASQEPQTSITADGAKLAFVKVGDQGVVAAYNATANGGESVFSDAIFPIDAAGRATNWLRITIREDYAKKKWDVYVDGKLALTDLGADGNAARPALFSVTLPAGQSLGLDGVRLSEEQVLFRDSDDDGMPDDYERANGLNPNYNDRDWDPDGDLMTNIEEFRRGRSPSQPGAGSSHQVYVDNQTGNNASTGALPYAAGQDGPMASLKAAMAAAQSGDVIVVLPGTGVYDEGSRGAPGKRLGIKVIGKVTIK